MDLCVRCKKNEVFIAKRGLCEKCYRKWYSKEKVQQSKIRNNGEMEFVKNYFTHNRWIWQPCIFRLNDDRYTPDFYDAKRNTFIEVSSTRQAYHQNKNKYAELRKQFPNLSFEIRTPDGRLLDETDQTYSGSKWNGTKNP